jgi:carboxylesterase type B
MPSVVPGLGIKSCSRCVRGSRVPGRGVFSPDLGAARLPVMVWIYGGAYRFGASSLVGYDGTPLARQNVVLVTFTDRIGVEGYAYLPGVPANRALLDQVAALRWVRDNIAPFGGDPDRVTVFGESAGAGAIASLLVMPVAAGAVPARDRAERARDLLLPRPGRRGHGGHRQTGRAARHHRSLRGAVALGDLMRSQWAAFAADGDPGWPPYAPGRRTTRIFDDPPDVAPYPEEASLHIWDQHRFGVLDLSPGLA